MAGRELISFLLPSMNGGGVERVSLLLGREFVRHGYEVEFALLQERGELLDEARGEFPVEILGVSRFRNAVLPIRRYLERRRPKILKVGMWPLTGAACVARRLSKTPTRVVVSEHIDFRKRRASPPERTILRVLGPSIYAAASGIIAVSQGVADSLADCARLSRDIDVIYNPIRLPGETVGMSDCPDLAWFMEAPNRIITLGRLVPQKDHRTLISAMQHVAARDARLLILGEGGEREALEALVGLHGLEAQVRLIGYRPDPYRYLAAAHLFVLSSSFEGLGNVILEALAAGVPVVSTDCLSGPRELLKDGEYGALVPVGDPVALATSIDDALLKDHDRERLVAYGRTFSADRAAEKYLGVFGVA